MNMEKILLEAISEPGERLAAVTKDFMEGRFDTGLGDVRIHHSAASDSLNKAFGALAFTVGNRIGFATGFNGRFGGLFLYALAHELVHVLQKRRARQAADQTLGSVWLLEAEADRIACEVLDGARLSKFTADSPGIVRYGLTMFDLLAHNLPDAVKKEKRTELEKHLKQIAKEVDDLSQISKII